MKANKALKRLAKIESLLSDVMERFPAPHARGPLEDAKSAIARLKEAVNTKPPEAAKKKASAEKPAKPKKKSSMKKGAKKATSAPVATAANA